jgi:hypothetical protein
MSKATEHAWHAWLDARERLNVAANAVASLDEFGMSGTYRHHEALSVWRSARADADRLYQEWISSTYTAQLAVVAVAGGVREWWAARGDTESFLAYDGGDADEPSLLMEVPC